MLYPAELRARYRNVTFQSVFTSVARTIGQSKLESAFHHAAGGNWFSYVDRDSDIILWLVTRSWRDHG